MVYGEIMDSVKNNSGGFYFVYGYGGTGKTFIWKCLTYGLRFIGKVVLIVSSSGIASLLLLGGKTAHSQFNIPLVLTEETCCSIKQGSAKCELIQSCSLIIWDEAPMINRLAFEGLDRTLKDIMKNTCSENADVIFGGKVIVLGGDFRQILPVIPRGSRTDIVMSCINSSRLWNRCRVLRLMTNMRLKSGVNAVYREELKKFADWILDVGDGKAGSDCDGEAVIEIPEKLLITQSDHHIRSIVDFVYPNLSTNMNDIKFFQDRAILAPTVDIVDQINEYCLSLIPGEETVYLSSDSICKTDVDVRIEAEWFNTAFLNEIRCSGIPRHRLLLKEGVPIMWMRNIDQSAGLCNGTRLIVTALGRNVLVGQVLTGSRVGEKVLIPRMTLIPSDPGIPLKFQRRQFPISVFFAMTINKSQGQSLGYVGIYLPKPVFTHGQLYVALSRVTNINGLRLLISNENGELCRKTTNVVYKEVF